jgi:cobalamin biosynthesis Mg chelatase CobN
MRKLKSLVAVAALLVMPMVAVPVSAVDNTCTVTNTGQGSNNTCTVNTTYRCEVRNNTVVILDSNNNQVATSGNASGSGNTTGGSATTGSATNSNGTTFNYSVTNQACTVGAVTTPKPEQPVGGSGGAGGGGGSVAATPKPTVLAKTSGESIVPIIAGVFTVLAAAVAAVRGYVMFRSNA